MIGDSWQLRKYSLLGHWAAHSAEPPGPWQNGRKKRREEEKRWGGGVGWTGAEEWGSWPGTNRGTVMHVPTWRERYVQMDGKRKRMEVWEGREGRKREHKKQRRWMNRLTRRGRKKRSRKIEKKREKIKVNCNIAQRVKLKGYKTEISFKKF